jgi:20S proteasome subunit beta 7
MIAADCLGDVFSLHEVIVYLTSASASYGSLARFKDVRRLHKVGDHTIIGAGGDMSDFQQLQHILDGLV